MVTYEFQCCVCVCKIVVMTSQCITTLPNTKHLSLGNPYNIQLLSIRENMMTSSDMSQDANGRMVKRKLVSVCAQTEPISLTNGKLKGGELLHVDIPGIIAPAPCSQEPACQEYSNKCYC